jgi:MinD-like ATPase involved in chromosome partitioning or flagellar assembly
LLTERPSTTEQRQATGLPTKADTDNPATDDTQPCRRAFITVMASGKGGVGKTSLVTNLGYLMAKYNHRVCLFDADTGLANIDIMLDLKKSHCLYDYLHDKCRLDQLVKHAADDLDVIPGASGMGDFASLTPELRQRLTATVGHLERDYDHILIDVPAGIGEDVLYFMQSADLPIVVINEQPTSMTDAFALLRLLKRKGLRRGAGVLVNQASNPARARFIYHRFSNAVKQIIGMNTISLGYVSDDPGVTEAVLKQVPYVRLYPDSSVTASLDKLAQTLARTRVKPNSTVPGMAALLQQAAGKYAWQYTKKVFNTALEHAASEHTDKQQVINFQHAVTDVCRNRFGEMLEYYDSFNAENDAGVPTTADIHAALDQGISEQPLGEQIAQYKQHKPEPVPLRGDEKAPRNRSDMSPDEIEALMYVSHLGPYIRQS